MRRHWYSPIGWWHQLEIILLGMSSSVSFLKIGYWCNFMSEKEFSRKLLSHIDLNFNVHTMPTFCFLELRV
jgi:hypothetical protein